MHRAGGGGFLSVVVMQVARAATSAEILPAIKVIVWGKTLNFIPAVLSPPQAAQMATLAVVTARWTCTGEREHTSRTHANPYPPQYHPAATD